YDLRPKDLRYRASFEHARFEAAAAVVHRGQLLRDDGKLDEAVAEFQKALTIDPSLFIAKQELNRTLKMINDQRNPPPHAPPPPTEPRRPRPRARQPAWKKESMKPPDPSNSHPSPTLPSRSSSPAKKATPSIAPSASSPASTSSSTPTTLPAPFAWNSTALLS